MIISTAANCPKGVNALMRLILNISPKDATINKPNPNPIAYEITLVTFFTKTLINNPIDKKNNWMKIIPHNKIVADW